MSRSVNMVNRQILGPGIHTEDKNPVPISHQQTPRQMNGVQPTTPVGANTLTNSQVGKTIPFPV